MALFDPVHGRLEHFAIALARNGETARDIVGETVLIAYEQFDDLRHPEAFLSYLFTIARRVYQRRAAAGARTEPLQESHWSGLRDTRLAPDVSADIGAVHAALARLPEQQREAVILFEIIGLPMKEIQAIQGGTLVAVKVRIARGRRKLAKILGVDEAPPEPERADVSEDPVPRAAVDSMNLFSVAREL